MEKFVQMKTKCIKCGYESENNPEKFQTPLCNICFRFAPNDEEKFRQYTAEKVDLKTLNTFRKFSEIGNLQKKSMAEKASKGIPMSRPPFGNKFENGNLLPAQNFREIEEIFEEFLSTNISLTRLSKKHNLSVNGLKKILKNFTYIGKIKFNNQIHDGKHPAIISSTLFNHVQNKLERLGIK
jgi:hypothetical protein